MRHGISVESGRSSLRQPDVDFLQEVLHIFFTMRRDILRRSYSTINQGYRDHIRQTMVSFFLGLHMLLCSIVAAAMML